MKQNEKWNNRFIILALVVAAGFVFFLVIRNDARFNDSRNVQAHENAIRDSLECEHIDCLLSTLNKVTVRLDSMYSSQKGNCEIVIRDMDTIKQSLNQISRTGRQILNSTK